MHIQKVKSSKQLKLVTFHQLKKVRHKSLALAHHNSQIYEYALELMMHIFHQSVEESERKNIVVTKFMNYMHSELEIMRQYELNEKEPETEPQIVAQTEPEHQQRKTFKKEPNRLEKLKINMSSVNENAINQDEEVERRQKQNLMLRLKKQYSQLVNSKYASEYHPINDSRSDFYDEEPKDITNFRNQFQKRQIIKRKWNREQKNSSRISVLSFVNQRNNKKVSTIFKKTKDFVDKIDPTNSLYLNTVQLTNNSVNNGGKQNIHSHDVSPSESRVVVKQTKMKQIIHKVKLVKEYPQITLKMVASEIDTIGAYSCDQEQFRQKLQRSLHVNSKANLKLVNSQNMGRNYNSVSFSLPKIRR